MNSIQKALYIGCILCSFNCRAQDIVRKQLEVSAQCDVYLYNLKHKADDIPGGAGIAPIEVDVHDVKMIAFERTSGKVNFCPWNDSCKQGSADGSIGATLILNQRGMSGIRYYTKQAFMVGVFTSSTMIPESAPESLFGNKTENYTNWGPDLQQVFFIGDGLTNKGIRQQILVPDYADKLYLGFADATVGDPSNYSDNSGSIRTTIVLYKTTKSLPPVREVKN